MNTLFSTSSTLSLIQQWLQSQNFPFAVDGPGRSKGQGRWTIVFDQVRVHLMELHTGNVLLQARVTDVSANASDSEKLLTRAMQTASARMTMTDVGLCIDADGTALWLQVQLPTHSTTHDLTQAVQRLVNEVELWRHAL